MKNFLNINFSCFTLINILITSVYRLYYKILPNSIRIITLEFYFLLTIKNKPTALIRVNTPT